MEPVERTLCECGCGGLAPLAKTSWAKMGWVRGQPLRFIHHHNSRGVFNGQWKGGQVIRVRGYLGVRAPDHPRANSSGYVLAHILVAETALGKYLPPKAVVHHVNEDPADNRNENLVICQDNTYHQLLHQRLRALQACGQADWRRCSVCGQYDNLENLHVWTSTKRNQTVIRHQACNKARMKVYSQQRKERSQT